MSILLSTHYNLQLTSKPEPKYIWFKLVIPKRLRNKMKMLGYICELKMRFKCLSHCLPI